jgi:anti-anti-sigma regulatory factor
MSCPILVDAAEPALGMLEFALYFTSTYVAVSVKCAEQDVQPVNCVCLPKTLPFSVLHGGTMNTAYDLHDDQATYLCPVCGNILPHLAAAPPFDAPCSECGAYLWCRQRSADDEIWLQAMPGRTPEPWEVQQVIRSLRKNAAGERILFDLSLLDVVSSSLIARLVTMGKDLHAADCRLVLTGLRPVVRETFDRLRLDKVFELLDNEEAPVRHS